jgi:hypothetical protein
MDNRATRRCGDFAYHIVGTLGVPNEDQHGREAHLRAWIS